MCWRKYRPRAQRRPFCKKISYFPMTDGPTGPARELCTCPRALNIPVEVRCNAVALATSLHSSLYGAATLAAPCRCFLKWLAIASSPRRAVMNGSPRLISCSLMPRHKFHCSRGAHNVRHYALRGMSTCGGKADKLECPLMTQGGHS
jgi:hypothetical protein